ncbi:MAG: fumarylacetoacetate hydrolase family protein [Acidobacteriia bacterium]|nr:fumarylacetoacetate hydrolase family protein [Terriglobia bacterium]
MTKYIRYRRGSTVAYGILDGETVREIHGDLFGDQKETGVTHALKDVKLLHPCEPSKILAVGLNYKSHVGDRKLPERPEIFYKPLTALQHTEESIVIPPTAKNVHYEGEMVLVIGKRTRRPSMDEARAAIFGVTCGNDVSERDWQGGPAKDLQWWRAKGADTFAPLGPTIVRGLDYGNLLLQTRLNGNVVQKQSTADLIFDGPSIVSWISEFVTLMPGDVIYTGTPGHTSRMSEGDVVEVDIEGIGVLRNRIAVA